MSLMTYEDARPWAKAIKEELLEKRMPPWQPVKGYGDFSNGPALTQRDIDLIVNWVEGGAPKGDDKDLPASPLYSTDWKLGKPDLLLTPGTDVKVAADADQYKELILDPNLKQDRWIAAVDLKPGRESVVHCATIGVRIGDGESQTRALATWIPGQQPVSFSPPAAMLLPAGSRVVVKVHYKGSGEATSDRSQVGLYFSKATTPKPLQELVVSDAGAVMPAGDSRHRTTASLTVKSDCDAIALRPRSNPLLLSMQATAYRPDGSEEVLIWSRNYQFDWQRTYHFKRPVSLPKGTKIEVIAYFDNSDANRRNPYDPPKAMRWSDLSSDPMFALLVVKSDLND